LDESDVESAGPIRVTSPARTVADCLRLLSTADALTVGDAAVVRYLCLREEVQEVLDRCEGWPFVLRARERLALLDRRRETPLESVSFAEMLEAGLPLPDPQVQVSDDRGRFIGRVDFYWKEYAVAGEADGLVKYGQLVDGDPVKARQALIEEKRREDRLRAMGIHVVRWGLAELRKPDWAEWLRDQLQRGDPSRFRGKTYRRHLR
jgi:hypothetical protein